LNALRRTGYFVIGTIGHRGIVVVLRPIVRAVGAGFLYACPTAILPRQQFASRAQRAETLLDADASCGIGDDTDGRKVVC